MVCSQLLKLLRSSFVTTNLTNSFFNNTRSHKLRSIYSVSLVYEAALDTAGQECP